MFFLKSSSVKLLFSPPLLSRPFICFTTTLSWHLLAFTLFYSSWSTLSNSPGHTTIFTGAVVPDSFEFCASTFTSSLGKPSLSLPSWSLHLLIYRVFFLLFSPYSCPNTPSLYCWSSLNTVHGDVLSISVLVETPRSPTVACFMYLYCWTTLFLFLAY